MFNSGIDYLNSHQNWQALYDKLPAPMKSPYFSPDYYSAYIKVEEHPAECFWAFQDDENFLFYPYLKRSINALGYVLPAEYYDICGAYGYNGPIGVASDSSFVASYNAKLLEHLKSMRIVTELIRYSPIPENRLFHTYPDQFDVLDNIYVDLSKGIDYLWTDSYEKNLRTSIRKGASYGLFSNSYSGFQLDDSIIQLFYDIYTSTMQRNQAAEFYYFGLDFVRLMHKIMPEKLFLIVTYFNDIAISFELLLIDGVLSYAILGGTLSEYYKLNPNTYQKNQLFIALIEKGIDVYSMGGGVNRADNLFAYKKSFNKHCDNPFYIGTMIHAHDIYDLIISQFKTRLPSVYLANKSKLQCYRFTK